MTKENICIVFGGKSAEHDVSILTAQNVLNAIDKERYQVDIIYITNDGEWKKKDNITQEIKNTDELVINDVETGEISQLLSKGSLGKSYDAVFPLLHGPNGEDGTIQGLLDCVGFSYIGNGLLSSAICMDKVTSNDIFEKNKLKQAKYLYTNKDNFDKEFSKNCIEKIGLPLIVKPSANGSSVGVSRVDNIDQLNEAIDLALKYDKKVLVEELIDGQEIEFAVVGKKNPDVSKPAAYITDHTFLDYDAKYFSKSTKEALPFILDDDKLAYATDFVKKCYIACGCEGFARVDIFYGKDGEFYVNEINTFPGFTKSSFFARLCELMYGMDFSKVLDLLIEDGLRG